MPEFVIDEQKQLVRATHLQDGLLTVDDVQRFNANFDQLIAVAVKRFPKLLLLIDASKMSVQLPEVIEHFTRPERMLRGPDDRFALVVGSNLAKLQARRVLGDDSRLGAFLTSEEAENWLLATPSA